MTNRKKITLSVFAILIVFFGLLYAFRTQVVLYVFSDQISKPQLENSTSIKEYMNKSNMEYDMLCEAKNLTAFGLIMSNFGSPGYIVFDKNGLPIDSGNDENCPKTSKGWLEKLDANVAYPANENKITLRSFSQLLDSCNCIDKCSLDTNQKFDFYFVYSWSKWLPAQCRTMMEKGALAHANKKAKIKVIAINLDFNAAFNTEKDVAELRKSLLQ